MHYYYFIFIIIIIIIIIILISSPGSRAQHCIYATLLAGSKSIQRRKSNFLTTGNGTQSGKPTKSNILCFMGSHILPTSDGLLPTFLDAAPSELGYTPKELDYVASTRRRLLQKA